MNLAKKNTLQQTMSAMCFGMVAIFCMSHFLLYIPAFQELDQVAGNLIDVKERHSKNSKYLRFYVAAASGEVITADIGASNYMKENLKGLRKNDPIHLLVESDRFGRNIRWIWGIEKDNKSIVSYSERVESQSVVHRRLKLLFLFFAIVSGLIAVTLHLFGKKQIENDTV